MKKSVLILVIILVGALLFYWFSYRPKQIRKECHQQAQEWSVIAVPFEEEPDVDKREKLQYQKYEPEYRSCLRKNGLTY